MKERKKECECQWRGESQIVWSLNETDLLNVRSGELRVGLGFQCGLNACVCGGGLVCCVSLCFRKVNNACPYGDYWFSILLFVDVLKAMFLPH